MRIFKKKRVSTKLCKHTEHHIYFDKDPDTGTLNMNSSAYLQHYDCNLIYCSLCGKKYYINNHYSFTIVRELSGEGTKEIDKKLVFPLRKDKLERILNGN